MPQKLFKTFIVIYLVFAVSTNLYSQQKKCSLHVNIENVLIRKGTVHVGLYSNEKDFMKLAYAKIILPIENLSNGVSFTNLEPGEYCVTIFQDLNNNGVLDKAMSIPVEPYGLSNNPSAYPSYTNTKFTVKGNSSIRIGIKN